MLLKWYHRKSQIKVKLNKKVRINNEVKYQQFINRNMDKNMSQTKNNFTSSRELAHQKSDKILSDTHLDEDSGLGVSGYSHEYPLDKNSAKSKGPQETSKQKKQGTDQDNLDSGFESGFQSEPLIDPKEMIQIPLDEFNQMCVTDFQPQYPKEQLPNLAIIQEIFRQDEDGDT